MPTDKCHDTFECRFVCGGRLRLEEFIAMHYQVYEQLNWGSAAWAECGSACRHPSA